MQGRPEAVAVVDVGGSNFKLALVQLDGRTVWSVKHAQSWRDGPPYRHLDLDAVWNWIVAGLRAAAAVACVRAIVPCTHGSAAVLVDAAGAVLPAMAYDAEPPEDVVRAYAGLAPPFAEVHAPTNPAGLTLARQLLWQEMAFPAALAGAEALLFYPQYWAWRLTGVRVSEVTALGAQTHLWDAVAGRPSSLARMRGWDRLLPPFARAWDRIGTLRPELAATTGLEPTTPVLAGVHDSNANYLRYLALPERDWTLLSTGTWLITFNPAQSLDRLDPTLDTVANTDVYGRPVACSRFMAGREFAAIVGPEGLTTPTAAAALERVLALGALALPSFTDSGGPVPGTGGRGRLEGAAGLDPAGIRALAILYVALMSDLALDAVGAGPRLIVDGPLAQEPAYGPLLAALRHARVELSTEPDGTVLGAASLAALAAGRSVPPPALIAAEPLALPGLDAYRRRWRQAVRAGQEGT